MDSSDKIMELIGGEVPPSDPAATVVNHISVHGNTFNSIEHSPGSGIANDDSSIQVEADARDRPGEMEDDLVRVFRGFTMRERVRFMQGAYDFEDQCAEDREREKEKQK